jgi:hypothetical protein
MSQSDTINKRGKIFLPLFNSLFFHSTTGTLGSSNPLFYLLRLAIVNLFMARSKAAT